MFFHNLETDRLLLKNVSPDDRDFVFRQFSDPAVTRYLFDEEPFTQPSEAQALIESFLQPEPRTFHRWILVLRSSGEKIGTCGFHCWDMSTGRSDIGYDLQERWQGKGYMAEAVRELLSFAERDMALRSLDAHIYADNHKSIALCERLGFRFSGQTELLNFRGKEYLHRIYTLHFPTRGKSEGEANS